MKYWTCDEGITVEARTKKSAQRKMERMNYGAAVHNVRLDSLANTVEEQEEFAEPWVEAKT